ncbi:MAG: NHL repeat-containing protein [Planctomycetota bacterium]|jgi:uncharacterized delta-60 repeat protein
MNRIGWTLVLAAAALAAGTAGSLDTSFDGDGLVVNDFDFEERAWGVATQSDGKIVAIGEFRHAAPDDDIFDWGVVRYLAGGSIDTSFGTGGTASPLATDDHGVCLDLAIDGSDRIVIAGYQRRAVTTTSVKGKKKTTTTIVQSVALARLNADGSLDATFGDNGVVLTDVPGSEFPMANSVVLLADGDILVAGEGTFTQSTGGRGRNRGTVSSRGAILLRYDSDGTLDNGFGSGGIVVDDFSTGNDAITIRGLGVQSNGRIVVAGRRGFLRRYFADGTLDTGFGTVNAAAGDVYLGGLAIDGQDRILVCGYREYDPNDRDGLVQRFGADGALDWTHVTGETETDELRGVAVDANGIVAGGDFGAASDRDGYVIRLNDDGTSDGSFSGELTTPGDGGLEQIVDLALDNNGDILLAGGKGIANGGVLDWLVARYCAE